MIDIRLGERRLGTRGWIASELYSALCGAVPAGEAVYLDVRMPNAHAVARAKAHAFDIVFETAGMYSGAGPDCEMKHLYGITTFELG